MVTEKWGHLRDDFDDMVLYYGFVPTGTGFEKLCEEFEEGKEEAVEVMWNLQADYLYPMASGVH